MYVQIMLSVNKKLPRIILRPVIKFVLFQFESCYASIYLQTNGELRRVSTNLPDTNNFVILCAGQWCYAERFPGTLDHQWPMDRRPAPAWCDHRLIIFTPNDGLYPAPRALDCLCYMKLVVDFLIQAEGQCLLKVTGYVFIFHTASPEACNSI